MTAPVEPGDLLFTPLVSDAQRKRDEEAEQEQEQLLGATVQAPSPALNQPIDFFDFHPALQSVVQEALTRAIDVLTKKETWQKLANRLGPAMAAEALEGVRDGFSALGAKAQEHEATRLAALGEAIDLLEAEAEDRAAGHGTEPPGSPPAAPPLKPPAGGPPGPPPPPELPAIPKNALPLANQDALIYAHTRAAELVGRHYGAKPIMALAETPLPWAITRTTRDGLRDLVERALKEGWSVEMLRTAIEQSYLFSAARAQVIARTELALAHTAGNLIAWRRSGLVKGKRAILAPRHDHDDECDENAAAGVIPLDAAFPSGDDGPPFHPNCLCVLVPITVPDPKDVTEALKRRLVVVGVALAKYSPEQPRDQDGKWTAAGKPAFQVLTPKELAAERAVDAQDRKLAEADAESRGPSKPIDLAPTKPVPSAAARHRLSATQWPMEDGSGDPITAPSVTPPFKDAVKNVVLYHGTSAAALADIEKRGLVPHASAGGDAWAKAHGFQVGYNVGGREVSVYMSDDVADAREFSDYAVQEHGGKPVILKIDLPLEMAHRVKYDERFAVPPTTHGLRFEGTIPAKYISVLQKAAASRGGVTFYAVFLVNEQAIQKYAPDQLRDDAGRFAEEGPTAKKHHITGEHAILTAENPSGESLPTAENKRRNAAMYDALKKGGYLPVPVKGVYTDATSGKTLVEHSFLVPGMAPKEAVALGKQYGQNGVITSQGYHDLAAKSLAPSSGYISVGKGPYTQLPGGRRLRANIDWGHQVADPFAKGRKRPSDPAHIAKAKSMVYEFQPFRDAGVIDEGHQHLDLTEE